MCGKEVLSIMHLCLVVIIVPSGLVKWLVKQVVKALLK